jgi:hypothetical protein
LKSKTKNHQEMRTECSPHRHSFICSNRCWTVDFSRVCPTPLVCGSWQYASVHTFAQRYCVPPTIGQNTTGSAGLPDRVDPTLADVNFLPHVESAHAMNAKTGNSNNSLLPEAMDEDHHHLHHALAVDQALQWAGVDPSRVAIDVR